VELVSQLRHPGGQGVDGIRMLSGQAGKRHLALDILRLDAELVVNLDDFHHFGRGNPKIINGLCRIELLHDMVAGCFLGTAAGFQDNIRLFGIGVDESAAGVTFFVQAGPLPLVDGFVVVHFFLKMWIYSFTVCRL
jgi:hypothetical protein